jgi:hypothetical protein
MDSVVQFGFEMMPRDRDRASRRGHRCPLRGQLVGHVEHGHVHAVEHLGRQGQHGQFPAAHDVLAAGRTRRRDQPDLAPRHGFPAVDDVDHHGAHRAGRAHQRQHRTSHPAHRPVPA